MTAALEANESPDVLQEVQIASNARKPIAPVIVTVTAPSPDLRYYIGVRHQIAWAEAAATAQALMATFKVVSPSVLSARAPLRGPRPPWWGLTQRPNGLNRAAGGRRRIPVN